MRNRGNRASVGVRIERSRGYELTKLHFISPVTTSEEEADDSECRDQWEADVGRIRETETTLPFPLLLQAGHWGNLVVSWSTASCPAVFITVYYKLLRL